MSVFTIGGILFAGADPLLQILYETDKPQETQDITLQDIPAVWRYRALISVNHLRQKLDANKQKLPVLRLFLKEVKLRMMTNSWLYEKFIKIIKNQISPFLIEL